MNAQRVMERLEEPELIADARLASTGRTLERRILHHAAMAEALSLADIGMTRELVERALSLRRRAADPRYVHPDDLTICAYAVLLYYLNPAQFGAIAEELLAPSPQFPSVTCLSAVLSPTISLTASEIEGPWASMVLSGRYANPLQCGYQITATAIAGTAVLPSPGDERSNPWSYSPGRISREPCYA